MSRLLKTIDDASRGEGDYDLTMNPYGRILISPEGTGLVTSDSEQSEMIIEGLYRRLQEIQISPPCDASYEQKHLYPHITGIYHKYISNGSEGQVFQFQYPGESIAIKFYKELPKKSKKIEGGIAQFLALKEAFNSTMFRTPVPYFATRFMCALEDFSAYPDYFEFIKKCPREKKKLKKLLEKVSICSKVCVDIGDIHYADLVDSALDCLEDELFHEKGYEEEEQEIGLADLNKKSSVFILEFHPSKKNLTERYKLGLVDVSPL